MTFSSMCTKIPFSLYPSSLHSITLASAHIPHYSHIQMLTLTCNESHTAACAMFVSYRRPEASSSLLTSSVMLPLCTKDQIPLVRYIPEASITSIAN